MPAPWEKYQAAGGAEQPPAGPWAKYNQSDPPGSERVGGALIPGEVPGQAAAPPTPPQKPTLESMGAQFREGEYSGLAGQGIRTAMRAAGMQDPGAPAGPTNNLSEKVSYVAGGLTAAVLDVLGGRALGSLEVAAPISTAVKAAGRANPVKTAMTLGGMYGGATSVGRQALDTGSVDPSRVSADILASAALPGLATGAGALTKSMPGPSKMAYEMLTGRPWREPNALQVQKPGQLLSEATPAARGAVPRVLDSPDAAKSVADIANQRIAGAQAALGKGGKAAEPVPAELKRLSDVQAALHLDRPAEAAREGSGLQTALVREVNNLKGIRKTATDPILADARAEAAALEKRGVRPNLRGVQDTLKATQSEGLPIEVDKKTFSLGDYLAGDAKAKPTSQRLESARASLGEQIGAIPADATGEAGSKRAALIKIRGAIDDTLERFSPKFKDYKSAYQQYSQPLNELMEGGSFVRNAAELQAYAPKGSMRFEQNPEKVGDAFVREGARGAERINKILPPERAEQFTRGYFARQLGTDPTTKSVNKLLVDNASFLQAFPETRGRLEALRGALDQREQLSTATSKAVTDAVERGQPVNPDDARVAMDALIEKGDGPQLRQVADAMRRQAGATPERAAQLGRQAVSDYFSRRLSPIADTALTEALPREKVSAQLGAVTKEWAERRPMLVQSGLLAPAHATDIGKVLGDLQSLSTGLKRAPLTKVESPGADLLAEGAKIAAHKVAKYPGIIAVDQFYKMLGIAERTNKIALDAMADPAKARALRDAMERARTPEAKWAIVAGYPIAEGRQPDQPRSGGMAANGPRSGPPGLAGGPGPASPTPSPAAQQLAAQGTGRDKVLAHISPEEARELSAKKGGRINPQTGLPEFGWWDNFKDAVGQGFVTPGKVKDLFTDPHKWWVDQNTNPMSRDFHQIGLRFIPVAGPYLSMANQMWVNHELNTPGASLYQGGQTQSVTTDLADTAWGWNAPSSDSGRGG
jgi:hypothetical protein